MFKILLTIGFLQGLMMFVNLVRTKVLAVFLGPEWIGVMGVVDRLLAVVAQIALLCLPFAAVRFLPELWSQSPQQGIALVRRMRNLLVVTALGATLFGVLVTVLHPQAWGSKLLQYQSILFIAFLSLPVLIFVPFLQSAIAGRQQYNQSMIFALAHAVVFTFSGVVGVWWRGLDGLYGLYAVFGVFLVIPVMAFITRAPGQAQAVLAMPKRERFAIGLPRRIWRFSLSQFGLAFAIPFVALNLYYQVLSHFGPATAGWMQAAMGIAFAIRTLIGTAHGVFLTPNVNRGGHPEQRMRWANEYQKIFSFLCVLSVPPLILFPHLVLGLLYSPEFLPAASFVVVFALGEVLNMLAGTYQALVLAFDHLAVHVTLNVIAQCMLLAVATLLIESYGILGVALAGIASQLFLYGGSTLFLRLKHGLRIPIRTGLLTLFVVVSIVVCGFIGATYPELSLGVIAGKVSVYGIFVAALALFLSPTDWAKIRHAASNARARLHRLGTVAMTKKNTEIRSRIR